jgi:hypothetical protein
MISSSLPAHNVGCKTLTRSINQPGSDDPSLLPKWFEPSSCAWIPVLVGGEAVAVMQADMYFGGRDVDALDRDVAAAFINGLGRDLVRGLLLERLHAQRNAVRNLMRTTEETARRGVMRRWPSSPAASARYSR